MRLVPWTSCRLETQGTREQEDKPAIDVDACG